ncbi:MAG: hypothetical protein PVG20_06225 [Thioalkalispiraceae bacterium]|jgi:hypothetical protein
MKITIGRVLVLFLSFFITFTTALADEGVTEGQSVYTQTNLWYEKPMKILALFHKGTMLPVGTKVKIDDIGGSAIEFTREDGMEFRVYTKYYRMDGDELAKLLFGKDNPMAQGGKFHKFTKMEREQIKLGQIKKGMSREAVIMSYCYPPTHKNPDLNADTWQLWKNRWNRMIITFKDNKVSNIRD